MFNVVITAATHANDIGADIPETFVFGFLTTSKNKFVKLSLTYLLSDRNIPSVPKQKMFSDWTG